MPDYHLIVSSEQPIPHDVLIEHLAIALRDFNFTGKTDIKMAHPFDTPTNVKFDDDVQTEPYTGPKPGTAYEGVFFPTTTEPADPYPLTTRVIDAIKGRKRG